MTKKIIFLTSIFIVAAPYLVFAARNVATNIPFWAPNGIISCSGPPFTTDAEGNSVPNDKACTDFCDIIDTTKNIIYLIMTIALFVVTPVLFAWGGIMIMTAGANPSNIESGKKILTGTLIGAVIVLLAFLIIKSIVALFGVGLPGITFPLDCHVP